MLIKTTISTFSVLAISVGILAASQISAEAKSDKHGRSFAGATVKMYGYGAWKNYTNNPPQRLVRQNVRARTLLCNPREYYNQRLRRCLPRVQ